MLLLVFHVLKYTFYSQHMYSENLFIFQYSFLATYSFGALHEPVSPCGIHHFFPLSQELCTDFCFSTSNNLGACALSHLVFYVHIEDRDFASMSVQSALCSCLCLSLSLSVFLSLCPLYPPGCWG